MEDFRATTFVGLALRPGEIDPGMMGAAENTHEYRSTRYAMCKDSTGQMTDQKHAMSLYLPKIEYSRTLDSLPFSHPKQIVQILPTLRQYAFTTSLLHTSFFEKAAKLNTSNPLSPPATPAMEKDPNALQIDVNLTYTPPAPRLTIYIPHPASPSPSTNTISSVSSLLSNLLSETPAPSQPALAITLDIHANGEIGVVEQNVLEQPAMKEGEVDMEGAERMEAKVKRVRRALEISGDLGVWSEWIRREVQRND